MRALRILSQRFYVVSFVLGVLLMGYLLSGCSSRPKVLQDDYAQLKSERMFEYDFKKVWRGIEATLRTFKVEERDPDEVDPNEWSKIHERTLVTDWIYSRSKDKYITYTVNESPRRKYLQVRIRYGIRANRAIGGTNVKVAVQEEIQRLNADGTVDGYEETDLTDTSLADAMLKRIKLAILSGAKP
jgi:hypothetical protein